MNDKFRFLFFSFTSVGFAIWKYFLQKRRLLLGDLVGEKLNENAKDEADRKSILNYNSQ